MKPQKAKHFHLEQAKKNPNYIDTKVHIFEKYDGWYGYYENGHIYSRAGRIIPSVQWLADKIKAVYPYTGVLIFEILVKGVEDFPTLNGLLNRKKEPCYNAYLRVHDFRVGVSLTPFNIRFRQAAQAVDIMNLDEVVMAPIIKTVTLGLDAEQTLLDVARSIWKEGGEGIIIKNAKGKYIFGARNSDIMKIKQEITKDLLVIGMDEGKGKYSGTLGRLVCKSTKGEIVVSGMTDKQRDDWWTGRETIIGKVIEVKAMLELPDGMLREPRFKAVRHDKTQEDID